MLINANVIKASHVTGVKRLVCMLSTCIYPDKCSVPIRESDLHLGSPHDSNAGYAYAKRMCEVQCKLYREQFGSDFCCVVPTNLYGPHDNYDPAKSHVVAALIERAARSKNTLTVWGTGSPLRQFCFVEDLCKLVMWVILRKERTETIALVPSEEYSIKQLAECVAEEFGIKDIHFDTNKADGQFRKTMSNEQLMS